MSGPVFIIYGLVQLPLNDILCQIFTILFSSIGLEIIFVILNADGIKKHA